MDFGNIVRGYNDYPSLGTTSSFYVYTVDVSILYHGLAR